MTCGAVEPGASGAARATSFRYHALVAAGSRPAPRRPRHRTIPSARAGAGRRARRRRSGGRRRPGAPSEPPPGTGKTVRPGRGGSPAPPTPTRCGAVGASCTTSCQRRDPAIRHSHPVRMVRILPQRRAPRPMGRGERRTPDPDARSSPCADAAATDPGTRCQPRPPGHRIRAHGRGGRNPDRAIRHGGARRRGVGGGHGSTGGVVPCDRHGPCCKRSQHRLSAGQGRHPPRLPRAGQRSVDRESLPALRRSATRSSPRSGAGGPPSSGVDRVLSHREHHTEYDEETTGRCERALLTLLGDLGPWQERITSPAAWLRDI
jgi:hypothetical protein